MNNSSPTPTTTALARDDPTLLLLYAAKVESRRSFLNALFIVELVSNTLLLPLSAYTVRLMCSASLLHLNLRLLFVWQSVAGVVSTAGRSYIDVVNLWVVAPHAYPYTGLLPRVVNRFGLTANIVVTPVLVAERIVATLAVRDYEYGRATTSHYFLYAVMLAALGFSVYVALADVINHVVYARPPINTNSMYIFTVNIAIGAAAYVVLVMVLRHNERVYAEELHRRSCRHNLSERYQRSENIRTSRQLLPVILLHVLQNFPIGILTYFVAVGAIATPLDFATYVGVTGTTICWFYIALQIAVIKFHPTLNSESVTSTIIAKVLPLHLRPSRETTTRMGIKVVKLNHKDAVNDMKRIHPHALHYRLQEEHFTNLAAFWAANDPTGGGNSRHIAY